MRAPSIRFSLSLCILFLVTTACHSADAFDLYVNAPLAKVIESKSTKEVKKITSDDLIDHDRVLPNITGTFLVVKTNGGRRAKLLVQEARQKLDAEKFLPMLLVDRYATYREGEERTVLSHGKGVALFDGFRLSLDLGQIVPDPLGGDLMVKVKGTSVELVPLGNAKLYLVTKHLEGLEDPTSGSKVTVGDKFEAKYFNGSFELFDDGRRTGKLVLKVDEDNRVTGALYSGKDGTKYDVRGTLGTPLHSIRFTVQYPRTIQSFRGWMFTGDGRVLTGWSNMLKREAGFYAVRIEK